MCPKFGYLSVKLKYLFCYGKIDLTKTMNEFLVLNLFQLSNGNCIIFSYLLTEGARKKSLHYQRKRPIRGGGEDELAKNYFFQRDVLY